MGLCNTPGLTVFHVFHKALLVAGQVQRTVDRSRVAEAQDTQGREVIGLGWGSVLQGLGLDW